MIKYDNITKIMLTVLLIGFMTWFGGTIARGMIGYDLFNPDASLTLKDDYSNEMRMQNVKMYANLAVYTGVGYSLSFLAVIGLFFKLRPYIRDHGWLFMAIVLFVFASPIQFYFINMDFNLAWALFQDGVNDFLDYQVQIHFFQRFTDVLLTTLSSLSFLANLTCAIYVVWKPLQK